MLEQGIDKNSDRDDDMLRCPAGCVNGEDFVRGAMIRASFLGVPISLIAGGFMETEVTDKNTRAPVRERDLRTDTELDITWKTCHFLARHPLLGDVHIDLDDRRGPSRGTVISRARHTGADRGGFFPAYNENRLYFRIQLPRAGVEYTSELPIINSAEIRAIPPIGVPYHLSAPVVFKANRRWLPSLKVLLCVVRMMNEERLRLVVESASVSQGRGQLVVRIENTSGSSPVKLFWHVSAPEGVIAAPAMGMLDMHRPVDRIRVELDGRSRPGAAAVKFSAGIVDPSSTPGARGEIIQMVF